MSSGIHKPTVAPKPKLPNNQASVLSPHTPRRDGLPYLSPSTARKFKPPVAPKPCTLKPTAAVESKSQQQNVSEPPWSIGLLNSQNGIQQNKKPEWDYIIPICLCSQENCKCISSTKFEQMEKNVKTSLSDKAEENRKTVPLSSGKHDNKQGKAGDVKCQVMNSSSTTAPVFNHKPLSEKHGVVKALSSDSGATSPQETAGLPLPHRTQGDDETNTGEMLQAVTARGQKNNCFGSEQTSVLQQQQPLKPSRKAPPVPVLRKLQAAAPSLQEKVEDEREDTATQKKREVSAKEVKMSSDGKGSSSLSVSVPDSENNPLVYLSARRACPPPAPTPRKRTFNPDITKAPSSSAQTPAQDVQEGGLGSDMKPCRMEESAYRKNKEMKKVGDHHEETHHLPSSVLVSRPQPSEPLTMTSTTEERGTDEKSIKKHRRHSSSSALIQIEEKEQNVDKSEDYEVIQVNNLHNDALKEIMTRELPAPPVGKPSRNIKPSGSRLSKKKAKSFSSADILQSEGQKRKSFRRILELKIVKKGPPKTMAKGSPNPYATSNYLERSPHNDQDLHQGLPEHPSVERKLSLLQTGVEQSVDGDEFSPGFKDDDLYDNVPIYDEISDYENVVVGNTGSPPPAPATKDRKSSPYDDDENVYEEQEPYTSFLKRAPQDHTQTECDSSVDEDALLNDTFSDDDTAVNTSDEEDENEDDSSSMSSKGDPELPGEKTLEREKKKSKIQHIATEIMSSESVFVDVLKLLHVDFRKSVKKSSHQHGKPVIEDHLLNQILYYLPQLYELNKDLLKELKQRVAQWDENSQIADIFLKKGPFLKMYSTYIKEFDKNVALLEEQTKKNSAFGAVVKEFQASPRCANLTLSNYLLKPVQRIPQYQLLLTDYLKNLSEDSNDYKDTEAALALVKEVASHANDIIKHGDNFEKLIQVQSHLTGHHHEIVQPGRIFLKQGVLMKLSRKVMQPRMFFLFNDTLLYTVPVQSAQYKVKNMLSLAGMKVSKPSQEAYQNELNIESVERSFMLSASSASERDEWLETISTAISEYTKKKISFISGKPPDEEQLRNSDDDAPLGSTAPIWIPDLRATMCMICTCEFTLTWRRHHCRACGKVVCQACSSNKYCLAYKKNQPARVCDQCFAVFQQKSEMTSSAATGSRATFAFNRKQKKIPAALKEVSANTDNSSMSGYLMRSKHTKKQGKRLWFVIKDKVLYTYAASEDVAALESQPLLGFVLKADPAQKQQFKLYHQNTLYYVYKADDVQTAQRWISSFKEATVL